MPILTAHPTDSANMIMRIGNALISVSDKPVSTKVKLCTRFNNKPSFCIANLIFGRVDYFLFLNIKLTLGRYDDL